MIQPTQSTSRVVLPGPAALRELAHAFDHIADFRRFAEMLEGVLGKAGFFEETQIQLFDEASPTGVFAAGQLTLPLLGRGEMHGVLRVAGGTPDRPFGPEDLHLLSALGAVIAAAMDHARSIIHGPRVYA